MEYQKTCRSHRVVYYSVLCGSTQVSLARWIYSWGVGGEEHVSIVFIVDLKYDYWPVLMWLAGVVYVIIF